MNKKNKRDLKLKIKKVTKIKKGKRIK